MKLIGMIAAGVMLATAGAATAGEWVAIAGNRDAIIGIDRESIVRSGNTVSGWLAWVFHDTQQDVVPPVDYALMQVRFDCDAMTLTHLGFVSYRMPEEAVGRYAEEQSPIAINPNTTWDLIARRLCSGDTAQGETEFGTSGELARAIRDIPSE